MDFYCELAWLPQGWRRNVRIDVAADGFITAVTEAGPPSGCMRLRGPVLPGIPNLHSHAHQRAMAGLAERSDSHSDSFWTWREVMYHCLARLGPEELEAIATQLYVEMLKAGYTAVAEFHYLHHAPDGFFYTDPAELSQRLLTAARTAGIGLTLLPVLYAHGGFGGQPPAPTQRRFVTDRALFFKLLERIEKGTEDDPNAAFGIAPHSLRAVTPELLQEVLADFSAAHPQAPIHIHIAEQRQEVEQCLAWSGARPVEWLLDHQPIDQRWCLVHATHMTPAETRQLAQSGAVAGLCPTTEANLGDGLFPAVDYGAAGGRYGIGSDSQISVNPLEEMRWLEYGQRLFHQARNLLATRPGGSTGAALLTQVLAAGARACARPIGQLAPGCRADVIVLDPDSPQLAGRAPEHLLDAWIFAANQNAVRDVFVGGKPVIEDRRHAAEESILRRYTAVVEQLAD